MTGAVAEFFADLREALKDEDPFVDITTLSPEILRPIQPQVDAWLSAPQSERRVEFLGVQFTIRRGLRGPLVRYSELMAVYAKFTELAATSERTARQQAAGIEAATGLAVVKGRADSLNDRLMRATEAQTAAELRLDEARAHNEALAQQIATLIAERNALRAELNQAKRLVAEQGVWERERARFAEQVHSLMTQNTRLSEECEARAGLESEITVAFADNDALAAHVRTLTGDQRRLKDANAALEAENTKLAADKQSLEQEIARLSEAREARAAQEAEIIARTKKVLADSDALENQLDKARADAKAKHQQLAEQNDALAKRVAALLREAAVLKNENELWKAQAQGDTRAAVRYWAEKALGPSKAGRRARA